MAACGPDTSGWKVSSLLRASNCSKTGKVSPGVCKKSRRALGLTGFRISPKYKLGRWLGSLSNPVGVKFFAMYWQMW